LRSLLVPASKRDLKIRHKLADHRPGLLWVKVLALGLHAFDEQRIYLVLGKLERSCCSHCSSEHAPVYVESKALPVELLRLFLPASILGHQCSPEIVSCFNQYLYCPVYQASISRKAGGQIYLSSLHEYAYRPVQRIVRYLVQVLNQEINLVLEVHIL
jgi:hypothetical protein